MGAMKGLLNITFLQEPAYRWALFVVIMALFLAAMGGVLRHM